MLSRVAPKRNRLFRPSEDELEDGKLPNICDDVAASKACRDDYILLPVPRLRNLLQTIEK